MKYLSRVALFTALSGCAAAPVVAQTIEAETEARYGRGHYYYFDSVLPDHQLDNPWFTEGRAKTQRKTYGIRPGAKNVILFVGDGMGVSTITAARILEGQMKGMDGEENSLSFDRFPFSGFSKTYNVDAQTPDSAGTMTAMMSGIKTDAGIIGIDEDVERGNCASSKGNEVMSALELAELAGKSTGIVTTARITHATPAATYAKSADRNWEDISDMKIDDNPERADCEDIASQLINFESNLKERFPRARVNGIEVAMGGGRRHFLPKTEDANSPDAVSQIEGDRTDGRNLVEEWQSLYPNGTYVYDQSGFDNVDTRRTRNLFALFNESHMQYEVDRGNDVAGEPSLTEMTTKAIEILDNNRRGFFLMVESGRIDHAHHAGSAHNALKETIELSNAVRAAVESVDLRETMIIVTADHSHVFTIGGYPKRGNPILGKVVRIGSDEPVLAADNLPYTTLGYTNGLGFRDLGQETNADASYAEPADTGRKDLTFVDTETPGYHQEALIPLGSETHAGEDVAVYGRGNSSHLVSGTNEQSEIFHMMNYAAQLERKASRRKSRGRRGR